MNLDDVIRDLNGAYYRSRQQKTKQAGLFLAPALHEFEERPVLDLRVFEPPRLNFSDRNPPIGESFIPGVDPRYPETLYWEKPGIRHPIGYMSSYHMLRGTETAGRAQRVFANGAVSNNLLLCGVMPDELQTEATEEEHIRLGKSLGAYGITTVELSLYDDDPAYYSVPILFRYLSKMAVYYATGLNVYPYIIGANDFELNACCFFLKEMGFRTVICDATGSVKRNKLEELKRKINRLRGFFQQVIVSNYCSPRVCYKGIAFMTPTWYKVPREVGCIVWGKATTQRERDEQLELGREELMLQSFNNMRHGLNEVALQSTLGEFETREKTNNLVVRTYDQQQRC